MSVRIRIPGSLRAFTDGHEVVTVEGSTVGEALRSLVHTHPGLGPRILDEKGMPRRFINVHLGSDDIRFTGALETQVGAEGEISIVPAIAGG